jgi:SARP family transcriptional regulator, regulator of embCAB operon
MIFAISSFLVGAPIVFAAGCKYLAGSLNFPATRIQLCGRVAVTIDGRSVDELPGRQGRLLLVFLTLNRTRPSSRETLAEALWPQARPPAAEATLSSVISRLRRAVGTERIEGREHLRLELPHDAWVDVEAALECVHRAEAAVAKADWHGAWLPAQVALRVTRREFLEDEEAPWVQETRRALHDTQVRALESLAAVGLGLGGAELAAADRCSRALIQIEPFRESGYRLLMETLEAHDNIAEGLLVYEQLRRLLRDELGVAPGVRAQALHKRLLGARA